MQADVVAGAAKLGSLSVPIERTISDRIDGSRVTMGVRPEAWTLSDSGTDIVVDVVEELGADAYIYGRTVEDASNLGTVGAQIIARIPDIATPSQGDVLRIAPRAEAAHYFSTTTGLNLRR